MDRCKSYRLQLYLSFHQQLNHKFFMGNLLSAVQLIYLEVESHDINTKCTLKIQRPEVKSEGYSIKCAKHHIMKISVYKNHNVYVSSVSCQAVYLCPNYLDSSPLIPRNLQANDSPISRKLERVIPS